MSAVCIERESLRVADILVTTGRAFVSGVIRKATGTDFSHTILYIGGGRIMEAISDGVVERELSEALAEANLAVALRRRFMTDSLKTAVVQHAKSFKGQPYDFVGAAGAGLSHKRGALACALAPTTCLGLAIAASNNASDENKDKNFFCSELVARCFELAGVPITTIDPSFVTPRSVRVAPNLIYVGHLEGGPCS
jgi:cell wall-associated NlpC family hydrolase